MTKEMILPPSTNQAERPRLILSREEERLIQRAWPFENSSQKGLTCDINTFRQQIVQYFAINEKEHNYSATSLEECLHDLRSKYNIIDVPLEPETNSLLGDSGLLVVTNTDGVEVIKPSQWRLRKRKLLVDSQVIMLFHGLPEGPTSIIVLLQHVLKGRSAQLLTLIIVALIAVLISLGPTWLQSYIFDELIPNGQRYLMIQVAAFLLCIKLTSSGLKLFNQLVGLRLELYLGLSTTALLVHRIFALPLSFFDEYKIGDLQQRVNSAHALRRALQQSFVSMITAIFVVVLNIGLVFFKAHSVELCLILLVATAFGPAVDTVTAILESYIRLNRLNLTGSLQSAILFPLESMETVRSLGLEKEVSMRFASIRHQIARLDIQLGLIKTSLKAITLCLNALVISILLYLFSSPETLSSIGADGNGALPTQGLVVVLLSAFSTINGGVRNLSSSLLTLVKVIPDTIRFRPVIRSKIGTTESSQYYTSDLTSLTLIRLGSKSEGLKLHEAFMAQSGETAAILHNNPSAASVILKVLAGQLDHSNASVAEWKVIINNETGQAEVVSQILKANSMLVNSSPVFTTGSIEQFISDYEMYPDQERLKRSLEAAMINMVDFDIKQLLVSGKGKASHLSNIQALKVQIARSLYSPFMVIILDGVIDNLSADAIVFLSEYCRNTKKILIVSTFSEERAAKCSKFFDARN